MVRPCEGARSETTFRIRYGCFSERTPADASALTQPRNFVGALSARRRVFKSVFPTLPPRGRAHTQHTTQYTTHASPRRQATPPPPT